MFYTILLKEIREIIGSKKFILSFTVCSLLIILSFYVGARWHQVNQQRYETAVAENFRQMEGITDWFRVTHHIFLPPQPLAALVTGIDNDIGRNIQMYGIGELKAIETRFNDDPIFAVFRFLDLNFIFAVVLALFAIVFGYNAVNGEKEAGTLRLVFANPVNRAQYILGKTVGILLSVIIPILIPLFLGCLLLLLMNVPLSGDEWIRLWLIIGAGLAYFSLLLLLSIFFSALTHKSANSFLLALVFWIFSSLIVPRAAVLLAGRSVQVPGVDEIEYQKAKLRSQLWAEDLDKMNDFKAPQTGNPQDMMDAFQKYMGELSRVRNEKTKSLTQRLNEDRMNRQRQRERFAFLFARFSPASSFTLAATELAGTSLRLKNRFVDQAVSYQQSYAQFLKEKTGGMLPGAGMVFITVDDDDKEPEPINGREIPSFVYKKPALATVINSALPDFGMLLAFNIIFFAGAFVAFLRFDVR